MIAFLVFLGFVIVYTVITGSIIRSLSAEDQAARWELGSILGAGMLLGSFFFLPWLRLNPDTFQSNTTWLQSAEVWTSRISQVLDIPTTNLLSQIANTPELQTLLGLVETSPTFTGLTLIFRAPVLNIFLLITLIFVVLGGVFVMGRCIVQSMQDDLIDEPKGGALQVVLTLLVLVLLTLVAPKIDTFGSGEFRMRVLSVLTGASVGYGVWIAWLGLALLVFSGIRRAEVAMENQAQFRP